MHTNILTIPQCEESHQPSTKKEQEKKRKMPRLVIIVSIKECQGWGKDIKKKKKKKK